LQRVHGNWKGGLGKLGGRCAWDNTQGSASRRQEGLLARAVMRNAALEKLGVPCGAGYGCTLCANTKLCGSGGGGGACGHASHTWWFGARFVVVADGAKIVFSHPRKGGADVGPGASVRGPFGSPSALVGTGLWGRRGRADWEISSRGRKQRSKSGWARPINFEPIRRCGRRRGARGLFTNVGRRGELFPANLMMGFSKLRAREIFGAGGTHGSKLPALGCSRKRLADWAALSGGILAFPLSPRTAPPTHLAIGGGGGGQVS